MKMNEKRARRELTLTPDTEFTLEDDGFIGALYRPEHDAYSGKVIITFSGTDGNFSLTKLISEQYVKCGISVLAVSYRNYPGLMDHFIPVETIEKPAL